jgi:hypothetical protein
MPNFETHCAISKKRTKGDECRELHKWMDEATESLKHNHRLERHFYTQEYKEFIEKKWGSRAVVEWLFHIAIDNLETANKFAYDLYGKSHDGVNFTFDDKEISSCSFLKLFEKNVLHDVINLKDTIKRERIKMLIKMGKDNYR